MLTINIFFALHLRHPPYQQIEIALALELSSLMLQVNAIRQDLPNNVQHSWPVSTLCLARVRVLSAQTQHLNYIVLDALKMFVVVGS
jgi:hypothetical protein